VKVLLIQPPSIEYLSTEVRAKQLSPVVGLAHIAAYLRENGIDVSVLDAQAERMKLDELKGAIKRVEPDIVGFSAMTHQIYDAALAARLVKSTSAKITTVIGGCHATELPEETLREFPELDFVVFGEGEITMLEFVRALEDSEKPSLKDIRGLAYRDGDKTVRNAPRELIEDLDSLPFPAYDMFPLDKYWPSYSTRYKKEIPVSAIRGCPFNCTFCAKVMGRRQRFRSVESVIEEIGYDIKRYGAQQILITDENFTGNRTFTMRMCEEIMKRGYNKRVSFVCGSRVTVDLELLKTMRKANFTYIMFGMESGNQRILDPTKKGIRLEDSINAARWAKQAGITADGTFILGLPYETKETIKQTIRFACKLPLDCVTFSQLLPYPGTEVLEMAKRGEGGLRLLSQNWSLYKRQTGGVLELETVSSRELKRLQWWGHIRFFLSRPRRFWIALNRVGVKQVLLFFLHRMRSLVGLGKARG